MVRLAGKLKRHEKIEKQTAGKYWKKLQWKWNKNYHEKNWLVKKEKITEEKYYDQTCRKIKRDVK